MDNKSKLYSKSYRVVNTPIMCNPKVPKDTTDKNMWG